MLHVFVETNWVIEFMVPFQADTSARELLQLADSGRLQLHIPGICLHEAKNKITQLKANARNNADGVRAFLKSRPERIGPAEAEVVYQALDFYESSHSGEISNFETSSA